jgi:hypothetical protein
MWEAAGPGGSARGGPLGVAVRRGADPIDAARILGRDLAAADPNVVHDAYEILSAIVIAPLGPRVRALSLLVDGANQTLNAHVSPEPQDGADRKLGSKSPNIYAITGTESEDDLRFVQVLHARDIDQALLAVEDFLDEPSGEQVRFWSAIELSPGHDIKILWLGATTRGRTTLELIDMAPIDEGLEVANALDAINRHRALMGMRPLDPVAASWTDQDILDEAQRIERLLNVAGHLMAP